MQRPDYSRLHPRFAWMRDYMARIAPAGRLPGRQHLEPKVFKPLLPFINLVDVERGGAEPRFRFRLVGTLQTEIAGREITGRYLEDAVLPEYLPRIRRNMQLCVDRREAVYDAFSMPHPNRDFIDTERIYFPLARDGERVDMLVIVNGYPGTEDLTSVKLPDLPEPTALGVSPRRTSSSD